MHDPTGLYDTLYDADWVVTRRLCVCTRLTQLTRMCDVVLLCFAMTHALAHNGDAPCDALLYKHSNLHEVVRAAAAPNVIP